MRKFLLTSTIVLLAGFSTLAQGTAFTYQGRLNDAGSPANGTYDLRFRLYDALAAGTLISGPVTNLAVPVSNGLFTVKVDFGSVFPGASRFMEIAARSNTVAVNFTAVTPRQELTPTPYAITSQNLSGSLSAGQLTGTLPTGLLSGTYGNALNLSNPSNTLAGNGGGVTNVDAAKLNGLTSANFWQTTGNAGTTAGPNYLGTPDAQPFEIHVDAARAVRIEPGTAYVGFGFPPIPNIVGGSAGNFVIPTSVGNVIGGGGEYFESSTNYITGANYNVIGGGWNNHITNGYENVIAGGQNNVVGSSFGGVVPGGSGNVANGMNSFAGGQNAQALNDGSFVWSDNSSSTPFSSAFDNQFLLRSKFVGFNRNYQLSGNEVFGILAPLSNTWGGMYIQTLINGRPFYGYNNPSGTAWTEMDGTDGNTWKLYNGGYQLGVSPAGNVTIDLNNANNGALNNGATTGAGLTFGPGSGEGIASKRTAGGNQWGLDFYTGFQNRMSLQNDGGMRVYDNPIYLRGAGDNNHGVRYETTVAGIFFDGPFVWGFNGGALGTVGPDEVSLRWSWTGDVWISNNCSVATLSIRGGADLAEPFQMAKADEIPQGAVVVIDEENPGQLKLSNQAYDTHVAGVVSGANGISPGIQMQQQGLIEGGKNVALTGRVYVQADASYAAIKPGDLLTTSDTPGFAMKVGDHSKAQGAILGKAMTGLKDGRGKVLVLVTLQ